MSLLYTIEPKETTLYVSVAGSNCSLQEMKRYIEEIAAAALRHQSKHVFCNEEALQHTLSILDTFELAELTAQLTKMTVRVAILCHASVIERARFYEDATVNRGMILKVFTTKSNAEKWLFAT